jgi:hypothetical protein
LRMIGGKLVYPYLVYVPGEIFDFIRMKGELWLARNQDDQTKTVGWIWWQLRWMTLRNKVMGEVTPPYTKLH